MNDYLILEAKDQKQAHYYSPQFHLYLAEAGAQLDCQTPHAAMMNHLRRRSYPEEFVLIDTNGRARYYEIRPKPVLIGTATLKPNANGFYLPTIEGYFPPEHRRLLPTSKTMGEA